MLTSMRPSDARREALKEADAELGSGRGVPLVSNFFPIERYYDAADKVLESFEAAYSDRRLDDAYVYGKRFAAFSMDALPKHGYYRLPKYAKWRKKNAKDMNNVIAKLEEVAKWMDAEEIQRFKIRQQQKKQMEAEIAKQKQHEAAKMRELKAKIEKSKEDGPKSSEVANSALEKLGKLNSQFPAVEKPAEAYESYGESLLANYERYSNASLGGQLSSRSLSIGSSTESPSAPFAPHSSQSNLSYSSLTENGLPPPIPPPSSDLRVPTGDELFPPPPSYSEISRMKNELFPPLNGSSVPSSGWPLAAPAGGAQIQDMGHLREEIEPPKKRRIPVGKQKELCAKQYIALQKEKKINVYGVNTYQGRYRRSTNACTVISPLVVSQHLKASHDAISDDGIVDVIDNLCAPIVSKIRSKLNLEGAALIIPSDVHDYLVDEKILSQESFVGASGGNILDDDHLGEFLKLLEMGHAMYDEKNPSLKSKKAGAALFFREHVVSIVKIPTRNGALYDLVDSLPSLKGPSNSMMASRTRCQDFASLKSLLKWYACSKFSTSNCAYIDQNSWDENMADFDPRVFQAFVWANK